MNALPIDPSLLQFHRLGVFADWRLPTDEDLAFVSEDLGFNEIVIGLWPRDQAKAWEPKYSMAQVNERVRACRDATLMPTVMVWLVRTPRFIESTCDWLLALDDKDIPLLLDAEEAYYRSAAYSSIAAAHDVKMRLVARHWGVTSIPRPPDTVEALIRQAKFTVPQCYSFWKPGGRPHWSHNRATFPGPEQALGATVWRALNPTADLIMGLGCYWAERPADRYTPKLTASQIMRFSCIETLAQNIHASWWWSLKWLQLKDERGDEVRRFFGVGPGG